MPSEMLAIIDPLQNHSLRAGNIFSQAIAPTENNLVPIVNVSGASLESVSEIEMSKTHSLENLLKVSSYLSMASTFAEEFAGKLSSSVLPTAHAQQTGENASAVNAPLSGETVNKLLGTLPVGEQIVVQFTATVNQTPSNFYSVSNTATITADGGISINSTTATNTVVQPASIAKAFGASFIPLNGTTTLTYTVTNGNPSSLTGLSFSDTFLQVLLLTRRTARQTPAVEH
jgi:hypothetical protein